MFLIGYCYLKNDFESERERGIEWEREKERLVEREAKKGKREMEQSRLNPFLRCKQISLGLENPNCLITQSVSERNVFCSFEIGRDSNGFVSLLGLGNSLK